MKKINESEVQALLDRFVNKDVYVHLETTTGAYSAHFNEKSLTVVAFIRNAKVKYSQAKIKGNGPYRIGLKIENGWVYAEGVTDFTFDEENRLLLAGYDHEGKLAIALQISETPFPE
ncbi:YojF family protein [Bacillus sp. FJAT-47783]|uniref:YojF family protein n=1 Tax=Bacillus sp. FJAT-47783 TaxID=2922712 RepID=UPI001FAB94D7|nr:YojF family protein [Bacillus sp. FJAT-47783]